jgi:hypothetical protein
MRMRPSRKQLLQHIRHPEHPHSFVLVDEIQLRRSVQLDWDNRLVEVGDQPCDRHLVEGLHALLAEPDEIQESRAVATLVEQRLEPLLQLGVHRRTLIRWNILNSSFESRRQSRCMVEYVE